MPIATLRKHPLRDFDLRDEANCALPLISKEHNAGVAYHALVTGAHLPLRRHGEGEPSESLQDQLRTIVDSTVQEASDVVGSMLTEAAEGSQEHQIVLNDNRFTFLLLDLSQNYILLAEIDDVDHRRVLKFGYEHELERGKVRRTLAERLGWRSLLMETVTPAAAGSRSYHAEVEIPEELRIDGSVILDEQTLAIYASDEAADRATLYASNVPSDAEPVLIFAVRAERSRFPVVSFAIAWVLALILGFGALWGDLDSSVAGPPISVLLAASALFAGAVAGSGEHRLVQVFFSFPRLLLVASALGALASASALAFGLSGGKIDAVWEICAAITLVVAVILSVSLVCAAPTTKRTT